MRGVFAPFVRSHRKICSILKQTRELSKPYFARENSRRKTENLKISQQQAGQVLALAMAEQHGMVRAGAEMRDQAKSAARIGRGESQRTDEIIGAEMRRA